MERLQSKLTPVAFNHSCLHRRSRKSMSEGPARSGESEVALPRKGHFKRVRKGVEGQSPAIRQGGTRRAPRPGGAWPLQGDARKPAHR